MPRPAQARRIEVLIVAVPETAGSALYGMVDVLKAAGNLWQTLLREPARGACFDVQIVSSGTRPFRCGNDIPVMPTRSIRSRTPADIVILPELWLGPDEHLAGRHEAIARWVRSCYGRGASIYSACSGALLLAETGLLDGREATSHWGYQDLFRRQYPQIRFRPEPSLCFADPAGRIVTAGGTTSWHDLALHIIARHISPAEAARIAKVYLLKWHGEGQLPYGPLVRRLPHADAGVRQCEDWLASHFAERGAVAAVVARSGVPARSLKRRFRNVTGLSLIDYVQNLRIDEARRLLEETRRSAEQVSFDAGYDDASFFRRLFRRRTGLSPLEYRRLFAPLRSMGLPASRRQAAAGH